MKDNNIFIALPIITNELWEEFNDTCLMTWDRNRDKPHWTQTAVDFSACLLLLDKKTWKKREER